MKIIYTTDLYGNHTKYDRLVEAATEFHVDLVINGGDMFPKNIDLHKQDIFIRNELHKHFERFEQIGIHYLCCPGNDDLRIFDELFQQECGHFKYVYSKVSRLTGFALNNYLQVNLLQSEIPVSFQTYRYT